MSISDSNTTLTHMVTFLFLYFSNGWMLWLSHTIEIFAEFVIPAGWKVLPVLSASHLDPNLLENPLEFNPYRWNVCCNAFIQTLDIKSKSFIAFFCSLFYCKSNLILSLLGWKFDQQESCTIWWWSTSMSWCWSC